MRLPRRLFCIWPGAAEIPVASRAKAYPTCPEHLLLGRSTGGSTLTEVGSVT